MAGLNRRSLIVFLGWLLLAGLPGATEIRLTPEGRPALRPLRLLPVQHNGLLRSLAGAGSDELREISGKTDYQGYAAYEVRLWCAAEPMAAQLLPILPLPDSSLVKLYGLRSISLAAYRSVTMQPRLVELYRSNPESLQNVLNRLESRAMRLEAMGGMPLIIPGSISWSQPTLLLAGPRGDSTDTLRISRLWFEILDQALRGNAGGLHAKCVELVRRVEAAALSVGLRDLPRHTRLDALYARYHPFAWAAGCYLLAALGMGLLQVFPRIDKIGACALMLLAVGLAVHLAGLGLRWQLTGRAPLSNLFEAAMVLAAGIIFLSLVFHRNRPLAGGAALLGFALMVFAHNAPALESGPQPLRPALQSSWLTFHVVSVTLSYAAFSLSFLLCLAYLFSLARPHPSTMHQVRLDRLEALNHRMITLGFPLLTLGIIFGAIWADTAWGRPWGFDPKETWAAITWLLYAVYLHARLLPAWHGTAAIVLALLAYLGVLFTSLGVNFLLPGLHSYA